MTRLEYVIFAMRAQLTAQCRLVKAAVMVLDELEASPERDAVSVELQAEGDSIAQACRHFNNLRSLVGTLERAGGNPNPQFYVGELRPSGLPIEGCHCGEPMVLRQGNIAHLPAGMGDLHSNDGEGGKSGQCRGEQGAVENDTDDCGACIHTRIIGDPGEKDKADEMTR